MRIAEFPHDENNEFFWSKIGRFFASPAVRNSVGGFMTSGLAFTWWVAFDDADNVMGFCAAKRERGGKRIYLTYAYTPPAYRGQGVYTLLFAARMAAVLSWPGVQRIYAVCNENSLGMMQGHGFVETGRRGQYYVMERTLEVV